MKAAALPTENENIQTQDNYQKHHTIEEADFYEKLRIYQDSLPHNAEVCT